MNGMVDSVDWIGKGILQPEVMVTHVRMPMMAISDFAEKGKTYPFFAELDRIYSGHNGLWCKDAEDYLLADAPEIEIGEPKELVRERVIHVV